MYTRASLTDILARKSARVGQVGGQVGEVSGSCVSGSWKLNAEVVGHADFSARHGTPTRAEVGEDVRVGVRVGPMEFKLYYAPLDSNSSTVLTYSALQVLRICAI